MSASPLFGPGGEQALAAAAGEPDADSLGAASRLRARFPAELAAAALTQVALRRRGRTKFGEAADRLFLTSDGLEQASRPAVATWRAERLKSAGIRRVIDLGCGIGADARAMLEAGLEVVAVELDPLTAGFAAANLPGAHVITGDAEMLADDLLADGGDRTAVFLDPARRTAAGRTWRVADFRPRWDLVTRMIREQRCVVKLGPGVPKQVIPEGVEACWVSDHGQVVEAGLWSLGGETSATAAVLLPGGHRLDSPQAPDRLPVADVGRFLFEPNGAVIRAGLIGAVAPDADLWLLDAQVAYLSGDQPLTTPFLTAFEVLEVLDFNESTLRAWVRQHEVGVLEIKKRAIEVDPAALRRRLKPRGPNAATLVIARTPSGTVAVVARRVDEHADGTPEG